MEIGLCDLEASLRWQAGTVALGTGLATLRLPDGFRYLDPEQSRMVLEDWWGNPPGERTLGMIFPAGVGPTAEDGWGVVLTYSAEGHVPDADAEEIDYDELLREIQRASRERSREHERQGYPAIEVVGWAAEPSYQPATHRILWARELRVGDNEESTLNYDVRVLGRRGVLSMNAVASMSKLETVEQALATLLPVVEFDQGNRYEDFDPGRDSLAAYGLGGLVAGKLAAKVGLFKGLLALLLAAKKLLVLAVIAVVAGLKRVLSAKPADGAT